MGIISSIFGEAAAKPIEATGEAIKNIIGSVYTTEGEKLDKQTILERLRQQPAENQVALNKIEAQHRSIFVAGWRPHIGWVCGISLGIFFIPQFIVGTIIWAKICLSNGTIVPYPVSASELTALVTSMLGFGALRTFEKIKKVTK